MKLKERLHQALVHNPMSLAEACRKIGIAHHILCRFMKEDHYAMSMKNKLIIEKWVQEQEKDTK